MAGFELRSQGRLMGVHVGAWPGRGLASSQQRLADPLGDSSEGVWALRNTLTLACPQAGQAWSCWA